MLPTNLDHLSGGSGEHAIRPGSRQGTTVCVHMLMNMEQESDHLTNDSIWNGSCPCAT